MICSALIIVRVTFMQIYFITLYLPVQPFVVCSRRLCFDRLPTYTHFQIMKINKFDHTVKDGFCFHSVVFQIIKINKFDHTARNGFCFCSVVFNFYGEQPSQSIPFHQIVIWRFTVE